MCASGLNLFSRSIQTYLQHTVMKCCLRVFIHRWRVAYSSFEFWGLVKETAMRTDAALTVQIDTPPGVKDTPEGISVTVELVVYMQRMSHSTNNNRNVAMNCNQRTMPRSPRRT